VPRIDSYADALAWLFARNQFSFKLGLEGPRQLLQALGNPHQGLSYVHVAGTNGKGSVCANVSALLAHFGFRRVGLYTSPHLVSFRERIRVDGIPVPPFWVTHWLRHAMPTLEQFNPTYFECVTAMAFDWFRERQCDAVVLETGMGGRLDATNVVDPKVTVITSIGLDHTQYLGNTLEEIWGEKLGIAKPGIPLIFDEPRSELALLAEQKARSLGVRAFNLTDHWEPTFQGVLLHGQFGDYELSSDIKPEAHQIRNAALSILAVESFFNHKLPPSQQWVPTLRSTRLPGRTQWLQGKGLLPVLLDGAHNPAGIEALCRTVAGLSQGKPRIVFAGMRDKDMAAMFRSLQTLSDSLYFVDLSAVFPRALKLSELRGMLTSAENDRLQETRLTWESLQPLVSATSSNDTGFLLICGSLYLLGEVIPLLLPHYQGLEEFGRMLAEEKPSPLAPLPQ